MAKPTSASPSASTSSAPLSPKVAAAYGVVKVIAMAAGFVATMLGLMASIGALTGNGYARVLGALFVTIALPLAIGDRLLPKDDPKRAKGLITEVMALVWVVFGFGFVTAANPLTKRLVVNEADRLRRDGYEIPAAIAYFLGGVRPEYPPPTPVPETPGTASASASATVSALGLPATSGEAAASTTASATAAASASAAPKKEKPEKTPADLFKELAPCVVTIFVKGAAGDGGGTGFVLDKGGTIVTNHHVIDHAGNVKIKLLNGTSYTEVELLADDEKLDLALLHIDPTKPSEGTAGELQTVTLGDSETIVVGERAVSIGNPLGLEHTLTDGLVSARRMYEGRAWIQMSVPVSPGNSGGPLFNMSGEVIGITTAQIGGMFGRAQNLNLAVPVNELKKLQKPEYPERRKFGDGASRSQW